MNYSFSTGAERIAVIEDLRKPGIFFPPAWDPHRTRQRESMWDQYWFFLLTNLHQNL
jgi:hypothetical protein